MFRARGASGAGDSTAWNPVSTNKEMELVRIPSLPNSVRKRNSKLESTDGDSAEVMV